MISGLTLPSVCVIDDEKADYENILSALNLLFISSMHLKGDEASLPAAPFTSLRLIFLDLHLDGQLGKNAASHTANVFTRVVSDHTAPVVVVIWSKYANDPVAVDDAPTDDQPTEADVFKETLIGANPEYKDRLIFLEMAKPKPGDRPGDWIEQLRKQIQDTLAGCEAIDAMWSWEALVRIKSLAVSEEITAIAAKHDAGQPLHDNMKLVMQALTHAQGEADCNQDTSPRHLVAVLAQSLQDQLEHAGDLGSLKQHGQWLSDKSNIPKAGIPSASLANGFLLTSSLNNGGRPFAPGTIYSISDEQQFEALLSSKFGELRFYCFQKREGEDIPANTHKQDKAAWDQGVKPVLVEVSPACDFAQNTRKSALLLAGLIIPASLHSFIKKADAIYTFPTFALRWPVDGFATQDAILTITARYKATVPAASVPNWLTPWFRLRELPITAIRNWHSSHASRVGYISLKVPG